MNIEFKITCRCGLLYTFMKNVGPDTNKIVAPCPACDRVNRQKLRKGDVAFLKQARERAA